MIRLNLVVQICLDRLVTPVWTVRALSTMSRMSSTEQHEVKPFESIPGPGGLYQWPLIGSLLNYKPFTRFTPETLHNFLNHMHDKYGPVVKLRLGSQVVVVCDPKDFETVYRNEGLYPKRTGFDLIAAYNKRNNVEPGLSQLQGEGWHALRSPINKRLMKVDSAAHYLQQHNQVADDLVKILATQNLSPEEVQKLFFRFSAESLAVVVFNKRLGLLEENPDKEALEFLNLSETVMNMIQKALFGKSIAHRWFRNSTYLKYEAAQNVVRRIAISRITQEKVKFEQMKTSGQFKEDHSNLLFSLLSETNLTIENVSNVMISLYFGGTESTSKYIPVFLYNLAKNPDKQNILRKEILNCMGQDDPLTTKALSQMPYLKAALKESFRLSFPSAVTSFRILPVDVVLGGYHVPAGVSIFMFGLRATRTHFENPDQYLPERWLRSEDKTLRDPAHSMIVLPFSYGPRNCIGQRFAMQLLYLAAVKILQRLDVRIHQDSVNGSFIYKPFIQARSPIGLKFTGVR
ncbi:1 25-dihydroxyvitamin D(3) 24-hydroxylase mitochondrial [Biomphalaria pfeifferi]|uniref:1 25-dihydroxyvitamin D(3) 24-hydroxylase mitochondrial n=1 Tax=Biomphalaria pfeifferi TaxID=112525 RepID=A0AAD8ATZ3_BIOPF|nr:1 25-dihydroxyvitamin D(3) 24-hydroxylase mitochondrial [Biomphalaria pfeifferi]